MDDDLNVRGAKALGFKQRKTDNAWLIPKELEMWAIGKCKTVFGLGFAIDTQDLKFTTSYDWAMLGVHYVMNNYRGDEEFEDILRKQGKGDVDWWDATPEQITQAWVEVLETESNPV